MQNHFECWPENWPSYKQPCYGNTFCDALIGPCACAAWHEPDEFKLVNGIVCRSGRPPEEERKNNWPRDKFLTSEKGPNDMAKTLPNPLQPTTTLLVKLGSLIVHYEEMNSPGGHGFDKAAIDNLRADPEVAEWFAAMDKLAMLPKKR